jgi:hypothetical protein
VSDQDERFQESMRAVDYRLTQALREHCRRFGHDYKLRKAVRVVPVGTVLMFESVEAEVCRRCGELRTYEDEDSISPPDHPNCRCSIRGVDE